MSAASGPDGRWKRLSYQIDRVARVGHPERAVRSQVSWVRQRIDATVVGSSTSQLTQLPPRYDEPPAASSTHARTRSNIRRDQYSGWTLMMSTR